MKKQLELIPQWGGSRKGAGRKKSGSESKTKTTKVIRVPLEVAKIQNEVGIENLLVLIQTWKNESLHASKTSPRWQKCRELLSEIEELGIL